MFQAFGAPKKINVCGRVTVERTRTQQRRLFHRTCVRSLEETAGAAATGCIGSVLSLGILAGMDRTTLQTA